MNMHTLCQARRDCWSEDGLVMRDTWHQEWSASATSASCSALILNHVSPSALAKCSSTEPGESSVTSVGGCDVIGRLVDQSRDTESSRLLLMRVHAEPRDLAKCSTLSRETWQSAHPHSLTTHTHTVFHAEPRDLSQCKTILRHILSQFTKFVLGDLKYFQDMTCYDTNYDFRLFCLRLCIWYGQPYPLYPFVPVLASPIPVPPFDEAHSTSII